MEYFTYDKENNLVSISNAIIKNFEVSPFHNPHKELDDILSSHKYEQVVLFLFDGFGTSIRQLHLGPKDFLNRKRKFDITSVFPPTTVAATNAILSGRYPCETSWLGWDQYFPQHDITIDMFTNAESFTKQLVKGPHLADTYCSYTSIIELINETGKYKADVVYPDYIDPRGAKNFDDFFALTEMRLKKEKNNFIYAYWPNPDMLIHKYGVNHPLVKECCKDINKRMIEFSKNNKDVLIIVLADHSLIDTEFEYIGEHKDFFECIKHNFALDSRSCFFYIKEGYEKQFIDAYKKYYQKDFKIFTKQEIIDKHLFGEGEEHNLYRDFLGDYMLTSISNKGFAIMRNYPMVGAHSGSTKEEFEISVSIINMVK